MAQGALITLEIKELIAQIHLAHPDYGPTGLRRELLERMKEIGLDQNFGPDWPGVSAVGKVLANIRANLARRSPETKGIDALWSIGSLAQYPIPPEALLMVLRVSVEPTDIPVRVANWRARMDKDHEIFNFTIRDALWAARLYKLFTDPQDIWDFAAWCSVQERIQEATGQATDFPYIHRALLKKLGLSPSTDEKGGRK
ncbi:MAG: hypothetical protein Q8O05_06755 [Chloroflexota bacterium]|nr:hypothetical protein [Chloroflexota bacterium]